MTNFHHGVSVLELTDGLRPIRTISTAVIGLVASSTDMDTDYFTQDGLTLVTDLPGAIAKAGTTGTLADALSAIYSQTEAPVIVSHITEGADEAATKTAVIGAYTDGAYTGIRAFEAAKTRFNVTPRILGIPGYEADTTIAALATTAQKIHAFAYAVTPAETKEEAVTFRDTQSARELMLLWPDGRVGADSVLTAAYALGLRAQIDQTQGFQRSLSNVAINGLTGIDKDVSWDLQTSTTDAGYLNENEITTLIQQDGFRFWGLRTCDDSGSYVFEVYTRTAQVLRETIAEAHMVEIGKGFSTQFGKNVVERANGKFREMTAAGQILGAEAYVVKDANGVAAVQDGKFVVDYDYTPVPPVEHLQFNQRITDRYIAPLINAIAA